MTVLLKRTFLLCLLALPLAACDSNDGGAEKLGESIDETADNLKNDVEDVCEDATKENC